MQKLVAELKDRYPKDHVITDAHGNPSVMVYIPRFTYADVVEGGEPYPHPAFIVGGKLADGVYISKFQNSLINGVACSLPDRDPAVGVDFDAAHAACNAKGEGWHLMNVMEWGAIALWCLKNNLVPFGNNDTGKDYRETDITARITLQDSERGICRVATGTGPVTWSHNGREDGIWDLNGNVWEWNAGIRLVRGELQFCIPSLHQRSEAPDSFSWYALRASTGNFMPPDGQGTTEGSVKLDHDGDRFFYTAEQVQNPYPHARHCPFADVYADSTLSQNAVRMLRAMALLPTGNALLYGGVDFYANNGSAERMLFRGGRWGQQENSGVFKSCLDDPRSYTGEAVGFRAAYYKI